ncbi:hypothetical protein HanXRQr2_Chr14g0631951 [Helianthus annuus]|uniref:Uncharacterized protein n=1 Tax=Helianthus annuus TaxID=4232 RepID=A0A9K3E6V9_HELAN|nr:hypothetical protein HanXRQr2_Chr14g0631951 [Helianthus annuus]KAJ0839381.1 hypothetical protein HanPSC8_Chr14g0606131 [Helianthus annuus]
MPRKRHVIIKKMFPFGPYTCTFSHVSYFEENHFHSLALMAAADVFGAKGS